MGMKRFLTVLIWLLPAAAYAQVTIDRTEPVIESRTFDPSNPPSDMPRMNPNQAAVTQSYFLADSRVGGRVIDRKIVDDGHQTSIQVDRVRMTLKLRITTWLPRNALQKTVRHEDGHKQIAEHYYANAEQVARKLAEELVGQVVSGTAEDYSLASDKALQDAAKRLGTKYLAYTDVPSGKAHEFYDQATAFGTNSAEESLAIARAIRLADAAAATMPTTRATD
jgi:hypothetical protein